MSEWSGSQLSNLQHAHVTNVTYGVRKQSVAALNYGAPGQTTWLEDPPLWIRHAY